MSNVVDLRRAVHAAPIAPARAVAAPTGPGRGRRRRRPELDRTWMADGACYAAGTAVADLFHPVGQGDDDYTAARRICNACPVIDACRDYALAAREPFGMWGGLTPTERFAIRKARP